MKDRLGVDIVLKKAADLDIERNFGFDMPRNVLTTDAAEVLGDPDIKIVIELIGGTGIAKKFIEMALSSGKSVVTANKALVAKHGPELFDLAAKHGVDLFYEAAVAGGIVDCCILSAELD